MKLDMCIGSNVYIMHAQDLGRYLEGQGHSMTLKQNRVRQITSLFEVPFWNDFTEMMVATLKFKVTAWPCSKKWQ